MFEVTSELIGLRGVPAVTWRGHDTTAVDLEGFERLRNIVDRLATTARLVTTPRSHACWGTAWTDCSPAAEREFDVEMPQVQSAVEVLKTAVDQAAAAMSPPVEGRDRPDFETLTSLSRELLASPTRRSAGRGSRGLPGAPEEVDDCGGQSRQGRVRRRTSRWRDPKREQVSVRAVQGARTLGAPPPVPP